MIAAPSPRGEAKCSHRNATFAPSRRATPSGRSRELEGHPLPDRVAVRLAVKILQNTRIANVHDDVSFTIS